MIFYRLLSGPLIWGTVVTEIVSGIDSRVANLRVPRVAQSSRSGRFRGRKMMAKSGREDSSA